MPEVDANGHYTAAVLKFRLFVEGVIERMHLYPSGKNELACSGRFLCLFSTATQRAASLRLVPNLRLYLLAQLFVGDFLHVYITPSRKVVACHIITV